MHAWYFWNQTKVNNLFTLYVYGHTFRYLFVILLINAADLIVIITLTQLFLLINLATEKENEKLDMKQQTFSSFWHNGNTSNDFAYNEHTYKTR